MHKKNNETLFSSAIGKLNNKELSVLLAPFAAINQAYANQAEHSEDPRLKKLREVIKEMEERMAERMKEKWMGADGTEYETYGEYLRGQWSVEIPGL